MITVTRAFELDAAHRLYQYPGECANIHGHRYKIEVTFAPGGLDRLGMALDFGVIKAEVGRWLSTHWDHALLLHSQDPLVRVLKESGVPIKMAYFVNDNPTAENMALHLLNVCKESFPSWNVTAVRVYETPNCWVEVNCQGEVTCVE
jgi:6-pyruvoyltetrahydropterin/6-carboxytetrahydropterin synthase